MNQITEQVLDRTVLVATIRMTLKSDNVIAIVRDSSENWFEVACDLLVVDNELAYNSHRSLDLFENFLVVG